MTISSIGATAQSYLSQLASPQQVGAMGAISDDPASGPDGSGTAAASSGSNALTGGATPALSPQTMQALLDMTQESPPGGTEGAHRHHHHRGGPPPSQQTNSTASTSSDPASDPSSDPTASIAEISPGNSSNSDSLEALLTG